MLRKPKKKPRELRKVWSVKICFQGQILDKYTLQDKGYICLDYNNIYGFLSGMNEFLKREKQIVS